MAKRSLFLAVAIGLIPVSASAEGLTKKLVLPASAAQEMIAACFADQADHAYAKVTVFVVDDGGHLLAAARQDGACKACSNIARNKAVTSALYGAATRVMADLSFGKKRDGVDAGLPGAAFVPGLVAFAGGLPVTTTSGEVVGGIGVSGVSSNEDEQCAQAGVAAIARLLKWGPAYD
ncbi:heme-binding protein [Labrenzia sp. PHM005]|uniref:GlcG/HbpS family heme-binding protein n=1 Tax=Labrenzia sp. PHM005 TaxID=2590016 RepID=UPI00143D26D6|nr:heme-binding protein [Labrenzia sp. PHM005]